MTNPLEVGYWNPDYMAESFWNPEYWGSYVTPQAIVVKAMYYKRRHAE